MWQKDQKKRVVSSGVLLVPLSWKAVELRPPPPQNKGRNKGITSIMLPAAVASFHDLLQGSRQAPDESSVGLGYLGI